MPFCLIIFKLSLDVHPIQKTPPPQLKIHSFLTKFPGVNAGRISLRLNWLHPVNPVP